jgi:stearoyl-CoA desaturase (delta-9 desaturase)
MAILQSIIWTGFFSSFFILTLEQWLIYFVFGWFLGIIGQPVAIHRYFTHKAFETNRFWHYFLLYTAVLVSTGSTIIYKSVHLTHHAHVDTKKDPHSPKHIGLFKTYFGYFFTLGGHSLMYSKDLLKQKEHLFVDKYYFELHIVYTIILCLINPLLLFPLYIFPAWISINGGGIVNAFAHYPDKAFDRTWITYLVADGYHKFHHDNPSEWQIPIPFWTNTFIRMIKK